MHRRSRTRFGPPAASTRSVGLAKPSRSGESDAFSRKRWAAIALMLTSSALVSSCSSQDGERRTDRGPNFGDSLTGEQACEVVEPAAPGAIEREGNGFVDDDLYYGWEVYRGLTSVAVSTLDSIRILTPVRDEWSVDTDLEVWDQVGRYIDSLEEIVDAEGFRRAYSLWKSASQDMERVCDDLGADIDLLTNIVPIYWDYDMLEGERRPVR